MPSLTLDPNSMLEIDHTDHESSLPNANAGQSMETPAKQECQSSDIKAPPEDDQGHTTTERDGSAVYRLKEHNFSFPSPLGDSKERPSNCLGCETCSGNPEASDLGLETDGFRDSNYPSPNMGTSPPFPRIKRIRRPRKLRHSVEGKDLSSKKASQLSVANHERVTGKDGGKMSRNSSLHFDETEPFIEDEKEEYKRWKRQLPHRPWSYAAPGHCYNFSPTYLTGGCGADTGFRRPPERTPTPPRPRTPKYSLQQSPFASYLVTPSRPIAQKRVMKSTTKKITDQHAQAAKEEPFISVRDKLARLQLAKKESSASIHSRHFEAPASIGQKRSRTSIDREPIRINSIRHSEVPASVSQKRSRTSIDRESIRTNSIKNSEIPATIGQKRSRTSIDRESAKSNAHKYSEVPASIGQKPSRMSIDRESVKSNSKRHSEVPPSIVPNQSPASIDRESTKSNANRRSSLTVQNVTRNAEEASMQSLKQTVKALQKDVAYLKQDTKPTLNSSTKQHRHRPSIDRSSIPSSSASQWQLDYPPRKQNVAIESNTALTNGSRVHVNSLRSHEPSDVIGNSLHSRSSIDRPSLPSSSVSHWQSDPPRRKHKTTVDSSTALSNSSRIGVKAVRSHKTSHATGGSRYSRVSIDKPNLPSKPALQGQPDSPPRKRRTTVESGTALPSGSIRDFNPLRSPQTSSVTSGPPFTSAFASDSTVRSRDFVTVSSHPTRRTSPGHGEPSVPKPRPTIPRRATKLERAKKVLLRIFGGKAAVPISRQLSMHDTEEQGDKNVGERDWNTPGKTIDIDGGKAVLSKESLRQLKKEQLRQTSIKRSRNQKRMAVAKIYRTMAEVRATEAPDLTPRRPNAKTFERHHVVRGEVRTKIKELVSALKWRITGKSSGPRTRRRPSPSPLVIFSPNRERGRKMERPWQ